MPTVTPGDVIKFKHLGMKRKFMVLGRNDRIKEDDIWCSMFNDCGSGIKHKYTETLQVFGERDWTKLRFFQTQCSGDLVEEHSQRIYLRPVPFGG